MFTGYSSLSIARGLGEGDSLDSSLTPSAGCWTPSAVDCSSPVRPLTCLGRADDPLNGQEKALGCVAGMQADVATGAYAGQTLSAGIPCRSQ